jgi:hypothetical protein
MTRVYLDLSFHENLVGSLGPRKGALVPKNQTSQNIRERTNYDEDNAPS